MIYVVCVCDVNLQPATCIIGHPFNVANSRFIMDTFGAGWKLVTYATCHAIASSSWHSGAYLGLGSHNPLHDPMIVMSGVWYCIRYTLLTCVEHSHMHYNTLLQLHSLTIAHLYKQSIGRRWQWSSSTYRAKVLEKYKKGQSAETGYKKKAAVGFFFHSDWFEPVERKMLKAEKKPASSSNAV